MSDKTILWILDNGHAASTPGKRSPVLPDGRQLLEYEFNRDVVERIMDLCLIAGIHAHNLVPETETDIPLNTRAQRANALKTKYRKVLISIHANAAGSGTMWHPGKGVETYALRPGGVSAGIADVFQRALVKKTSLTDRGVKYANFAILRLTDCPAILTENGFFTHSDEVVKLLDPAFRQQIAEAHVQAMIDYQKQTR